MKSLRQALTISSLSLSLIGCGSVSSHGPSASELMLAPTSLNLSGQALRADASTLINPSAETLSIKIALDGEKEAKVSQMSVSSVYLITQGGIWQAPGRWFTQGGCLEVRAVGAAKGLREGEQVQVVVRFKNSSGQTYWLRDSSATIISGKGFERVPRNELISGH